MELRAFEKEDYDLLISWIDSNRLNYQWGGPNFTFPLDVIQITTHCAQPEVIPFIFVVDGKRAGYVELFQVSKHHLRICRVFVSNDFRGKKVAKSMLNQLIDLAKLKYCAHKLSLAVFQSNRVALGCYESLGFLVTSSEHGTREFDGEDWGLLRMEKRL
jgi:RimJ/RimL family protein N-acetyltransferase